MNNSLDFCIKGQLAIGGLNVRYIPAAVDRAHLAGDTRESPVAARSESFRGSAGDSQEIPRSTERRVSSRGIAVRAETAPAEEEAKLAEALDEKKRSGAVRHNAQLLLLPTIFRALRGYLLRGRYRRKLRSYDRPLSRRRFDRFHSPRGQSPGGWCFPKIRPANPVGRLRHRHGDLHGRIGAVPLPERQRIRNRRRRSDTCSVRADVHIHEHPWLPGDPLRHGGRSVPVQGQGHTVRPDNLHRLHLQLDYHQDVSRHDGCDGQARRVPFLRSSITDRRHIHSNIPARNEGEDSARDRGYVRKEEKRL